MDALPEPDSRTSPPLGRDMPCPSCCHSWHSPFRCDEQVDAHFAEPLCPCRRVPIPGAYP